MGLLPTARNSTYGAATPVKSADLNDIQDCIIGLKHADVLLHINQYAIRDFTAGTYNIDYVSTGGAGTLWLPLPVKQGDRLKSLTIARKGVVTANGNLTYNLHKTTNAGVGSTQATQADNAIPNAWGQAVFDFADFTVAAGEVFLLEFVAGGAVPNNIFIGGTILKLDRV